VATFSGSCQWLAPSFHLPSPSQPLQSSRAFEADILDFSESTSIPVNPRTNRPVGYAFVDFTSAPEADRAISELSGKEILDRKVSVQLARNPAEKNEASGGEASGGEGRKRGSGRGRGRGRGRGGRFGRGGRTVSLHEFSEVYI
jgi:RNA recognition motif-containing protein